jgi:hypothetical protein
VAADVWVAVCVGVLDAVEVFVAVGVSQDPPPVV